MFDEEIGSVTSSQRASYLGLQTLLTIIDLEPLDLQTVASSANQAILAEPTHLEVTWVYCMHINRS
ncbi:conserved hypothetical protein [Vibrio harveyi]|uniref:Uncharacterized protein n=2 Tax=Vibrio harveyi group TaxID=717610 RepID=A0A1E3E5T8_VIBHA|nr:hypothetical protein VIBHAR_00533 [Vibrio campbellii ATCC BAA-1116]AMF98014.1 hypothetical protein AL538_10055 [Vibrio harveyi]OQQ01192.1 hypothetical protein BK412_18840 [Vibrio campbellii]AGU96648.1 hypothetical protein M892_10145 [Vibrio campbellii ATCC BAA-1116]APP06229.1 hypothetical protein BG259_13400 [Vibrio harveyi]